MTQEPTPGAVGEPAKVATPVEAPPSLKAPSDKRLRLGEAITVKELAEKLEARSTNFPRWALEALAVAAYRSGTLTSAEVQRMLGLPSRWETDELLKRAGAFLDYTEDDLHQDIETLRRLR